MYGPAWVLLGVKDDAVAIPLPLVTAVVLTPVENVPLAPLAGAVNVTVTPLIGLLPASFTVACRPVANAVLIAPVVASIATMCWRVYVVVPA